MGDVVNLREFRKQRKRQDKATRAATNRRKHGRTKSEVARDQQDSHRQESELDAKRLDDNDNEQT